MPKCPKCGKDLKTDAKFCKFCGATLEGQVSSKPAATPSKSKPSPPPQTQPTPEPPKKGMSKGAKIAIIIVSILLILGIAGGVMAYFLIKSGLNEAGEKIKEQFGIVENSIGNLNEEIGNLENQENANEENENLEDGNAENINAAIKSGKPNPIRPAKDQTIAIASSSMKDNTSIGFDYSPAMVLDQDFSTSWVEGVQGHGVDEWIELEFPSEVVINTLGIVPGYARNEDIYFKNNRVKDFELEFSDGTRLPFNIADQYGMQFVEFPSKKTDSLKLTIKYVYLGSKYDDTCIAEMDIWAQYVLDKNAQAAMDYYQQNKEPYAKRPPSEYIIEVFMTNDVTENLAPADNVTSYNAGKEALIASAQLRTDTHKGKTFTCKWYQGDKLIYEDSITQYTQTYGGDKMYIASVATLNGVLGPPNVVWPMGDYRVEWFVDGKWSKTVNFKVGT